MKKLLLLTAIVTMLSLGARAQSDGFFRSDNGENYSDRNTSSMPAVLSGDVGGMHDSDALPLGSGLLIISALGGAYLLRRSQK